MASALHAKQLRSLLQSIHVDPQLKQSKDSILLAEDQYPETLDTIINRLTTPTTLQIAHGTRTLSENESIL